MNKKGLYSRFFKRLIDFSTSLISIIMLLPLFVFTSIIIWVKLGSPILFKQQRVGLNNKVFTLYKFRTMTNDKDEYGNLLSDELRINKIGKILRKTSIDELPELFNILKGDMSIVGPRPLLVEYLPYYKENERVRHLIRPGLTGLAQINGRSFITWDDIFLYDIYYYNNLSFVLDLKIIFKTVLIVLRNNDVADVSSVKNNPDGSLQTIVNGEYRNLHLPLNIERGTLCKKK